MALAGSGAAAAAFVGACGSSDGESGETAQFGDGDTGILNYLLMLDYMQVAIYGDLVKSGFFQGGAREAMRKFEEEEAQHVSRLTKAVERMGGEPTPRPRTELQPKSRRSGLEVASTLESLGAAAYLGQVPNFASTSALALALSIHSVEGRHAAAIDSLLGKPITPDGAFAEPASAKTTLKAIKPFIVE